jgi:hypothetical protein
MFCPNCGRNVGGATRFCRFCGGSLSPSLAAAGTARGSVSEKTAYSAVTLEDDLKGVFGWLLLFCVILTVVGPLVMVAGGRSGSLLVDLFSWAKVVFGIFVGINLWSQSPHALKLLRIYFVVALVLGVLRLVSSVVLTFTAKTEGFYAAYTESTASLVSLVVLGVWLAYFHFSKRVQSTYGSNL